MSTDRLQNAALGAPEPPHAVSPGLRHCASRAPACVICNRSATASFVVHQYRFFECSGCDFAFIDPASAASYRSRSIFDDGYFHGGGAGYTNYLDEAALLQEHGDRYGALLAKAGARSVLDVGAAAGFILAGMQRAGCTGIGIEPNASMAAFARRQLGLDVRETTLEQFDSTQRFDAVALVQVVDHLEDVQRSFERVATLTRPGGLCLVEFGNRASLTARVLGTAWHEYAPPSVQRVFSLRALRRLLGAHGFALHSSGHPKKYLRADHALSLLRYKSVAWLGDGVFANVAAVIPPGTKLRYVGNDITWALFARA